MTGQQGVVADGPTCHGLCRAQPAPSRPAAKRCVRWKRTALKSTTRSPEATEQVRKMKLIFEIEREDDGRWLAEIGEIPGVLAYGLSEAEATGKAQALALRVIADRLEHGEQDPSLQSIGLAAA